MTRYLISFDDGAMTFPEEDCPTWPKPRTRWSRKPRMQAWVSAPVPQGAGRKWLRIFGA